MRIYKHKGKNFQRIGNCKLCGQCCKDLALEVEIPIEPNGKSIKELAKIKKQKEIQRYIKKGYKDVEASRITWLTKDLMKFTISLTCPYLENKKCVIHKERGYSKKPAFCQRFPTPEVTRPKGCGYRFKKLN